MNRSTKTGTWVFDGKEYPSNYDDFGRLWVDLSDELGLMLDLKVSADMLSTTGDVDTDGQIRKDSPTRFVMEEAKFCVAEYPAENGRNILAIEMRPNINLEQILQKSPKFRRYMKGATYAA